MLRRVLHAANAIVLGNLIARSGGLILVPLFLRYWSAPRYGEYVALFAAVSYLASLDIGMQGAAVNRLTQAYARKNLDEYRSVQHTALAFFIVLAAAASVCVAALAWRLPIAHWLGLSLTPSATASIAVILLAVYVMWSMPVQVIVATYQTIGNLAKTQWIRNVQQMLVVALTALALVLGAGMKTIALFQVLTVGFLAAFILLELRRKFPELAPGLRAAKLSLLTELMKPSLLFALIMVGNLIAYEGSILLTSALMGGLAVAMLSISKSLVDVLRLGIYSVSLALCPDYARMEALGEFSQLRKLHRISIAATAAFTLALVASLWYEGTQLITVWTRGRIDPDPTLLRLFLVLMAFQTSWAVSSTVARASNRHYAQAIGYFFAAIVGIGFVAVLIRVLGTWAIPLGLTLGEAICCYHFVIKSTCRIIGEPYGRFALRFWVGFGVVGAAALATGSIVHTMPLPLLLRCMLMGLATLTVAIACGYLIWLTHEDRALFTPTLRPQLDASNNA
jgi:O-antigen/teichoic acid export membrane protein